MLQVEASAGFGTIRQIAGMRDCVRNPQGHDAGMKSLMFSAIIATGACLHAAEPTAQEWKAPDGTVIRYRWSAPEAPEAGKTYPLVVFLHGAGERGDDNKAQLRHGVSAILSGAKAIDEPCFLIAPQCPSDSWWAPIDRGSMRLSSAEKPNALLDALIARIDLLAKEHPIDTTRLYLTGLSMGGFASWDLLGRAPGKFAAVVPICGGGDPTLVAKYKSTPIWVFHGEKDDVVPLRTSTEMVEALKKAGGEPKFTWYPEAGHDSWTAAYQDPKLIRWIFDQKLAAKDPG
jgi:predicted peptidase